MILGIDCSRMEAAQPTGVELYTDRVITGLLRHVDALGYEEIRCYVKNAPQLEAILDLIGETQKGLIKPVLISRQRMWTFLGLSWEMLRRPVNCLFVPSHMLPLICPKRSVLTVHGIESLLFPKAYTWKQRFLQRFALWQAKRKKTQLIAVSKIVKKQLIERLGVPEERIDVVWNGFDAIEDGEGPNNKGQGPNEKVQNIVKGDFILSVGRLEERKNQKRLIQAFEKIAEKYPKLKLVLVGPDGYGAEAVKKQVEESSVKERIILAGYLDRFIVRSLMASAQIFAYPSLSEGFGIPILEAFSVGCPVLTSKDSATEEVAAKAAVYCDPFSIDSIAQGLESLLEDSSVNKKIVQEGRQRLELFSWEKCVGGLVNVLRIQSE